MPSLIPGDPVDFLSATETLIYHVKESYAARDAAQTWNTVSPDFIFDPTFARMGFSSRLMTEFLHRTLQISILHFIERKMDVLLGRP